MIEHTTTETSSKPTVAAADLQAEISGHITDLLVLLPDVEALTDSYQSGRGFLTPEGRATLDAQTRAERRDLRVLPTRGEVGLKWLSQTTIVTGTGDIPTPGNFRGISCEADIAYALQHHARHIERTLRASGHPVPQLRGSITTRERAHHRPHGFIGPMPALVVVEAADDQPTIPALAARVRDLVYSAPSPKLLRPIARDLARLVEQAELVVHGNDRTNWTDPCPFCGELSLIHYLRESVVRCEYDPSRRTSHPLPCVCPDSFCPCKHNPTGHRHEWAPNPAKARYQRSLWQLHGDVTRIKEINAMETRAQDALTAVRDLHAPVEVPRPAHQCQAGENADNEHTHVELEDDALICLECPPGWYWCSHCTHDTDETVVVYPCPTIAAIDTIAPPARVDQ